MTAAAVRTGTVDASGLSLAYREQGHGAPVLLVHGSGVGQGLWDELVTVLGEDVRTIAYDRRAYGLSEAPEPYRGTSVAEQAEDAAAVIEAVGAAPATVCGHELGALVALDLLRRHPTLVGAAVLVEPPVLALSTGGPAAVAELRGAIERGAREAKDTSAGAVDAYLTEVAGERFSELLGEERLREARGAARPLAADLAAAPTFAFGRRELGGIDAPVAVVTGARSAPVRREVARSLAGLLGNATLHEADSGHFVALEAPEAVADAIRQAASGR